MEAGEGSKGHGGAPEKRPRKPMPRWIGPGIGALLVILVVGFFSLLPDGISRAINEKFPPVSLGQQRAEAVRANAKALAALPLPNVAYALQLSDLRRAIPSDKLAALGITGLAFRGEDQLIMTTVGFRRTFTGADAPGDAEVAQFLNRHRPTVAGELKFAAGVSSELTVTDDRGPVLAIRLLPSFESLTVSSVKAESVGDVSGFTAPLVATLNHFHDNVSGELSRATWSTVSIPALGPQAVNFSRSVDSSGPGSNVTLELRGASVPIPVQLTAAAWAVSDKQLLGVIGLSPLSAPPVTGGAPVPETATAVRERVAGLINARFDGFPAQSKSWVSIRKDLVAFSVNGLIREARLCATARGSVSNQHAASRIKLPSHTDISCSSERDCASTRDCTFTPSRDTRECSRCLAHRPFGGGCAWRGNDPFCEAAKAAQNAAYDVDVGARKFDCERLKVTDKLTCEAEETVKKGICETAKEAYRHTLANSELANLDTDVNLKTDNLSVCIADFTLSDQLESLKFGVDAVGSVKAQLGVDYVPLNIAGHLICQNRWSDRRTFAASIDKPRVTIETAVQIATDKGNVRMSFDVAGTGVAVKLRPSPGEYLVTNMPMTVSCAGANLMKPLIISLTPYVPELRGEIDVAIPKMNLSTVLAVPEQRIGDSEFDLTARNTINTLAVIARPRN